MQRIWTVLVAGWLAGMLVSHEAIAQALVLTLPTDNDAIYEGRGDAFYQYTDRYFKGKRSRPWEGGQYGFVRNLEEIGPLLVFTKFHEGLDIRPVRRSRTGEPLDPVVSVDAGKVVYVNDDPRESSYGRYVVVEHWWSDAPFYSLYAHLGDARVQSGQRVERGERLGTLGYTGRGINKRRAHVHFEINLLLHEQFPAWHDANYRSSNEHGIYNGINMAGLDPSVLLVALRDDPMLAIDDFLLRQQPFFTVAAPNVGGLDLLNRYPWLWENPDAGELAAWEIDFAQSGLPLRVRSTALPIASPIVRRVQATEVSYDFISNGLLDGINGQAWLTPRGLRYLDLLTMSTPSRLDPVPLRSWW